MQTNARYRRQPPKRSSPLVLLVPFLIIIVLVIAIFAVLFSGNASEVQASAATETPAPTATAAPTPEARTADIPQRSAVHAPVLVTGAELGGQSVSERLDALRGYFTDGKYWNHFGTDYLEMSDEEMAMSITDTPCAHEENGYEFCNVYIGATGELFPEYDYDTQCLGFASLISDLLFGTDAPLSVFYEFEDLRVGDHIRLISVEHSMVVTSVDAVSGSVRVLDVNADYENCQIDWDREFTYDDLLETGSSYEFITRYE